MTNKTLMKILAGSTMAAVLLPVVASAHGLGLGLNLGGGLKLGEDHTVNATADANANASASFHRDGDNDKGKGDDRDGNKGVHATTTATSSVAIGARITKQGTRLQNIATFFTSIVPNIQAAITGSGANASTTANANAKLVDFGTQVANGKTQATSAINVVAGIGTTTSTTTASTLIAEARADLQAARDFLKQARHDLANIFSLIFGAKVDANAQAN